MSGHDTGIGTWFKEIRIPLDDAENLDALCNAMLLARTEILNADGDYVSHETVEGDCTMILVITYEALKT